MAKVEKVTLTLPKELMENVREIAPSRGVSKFVAEAIEFFIETQQRRALRERLVYGYKVNAEKDREINQEWETIDDETWDIPFPPHEEGNRGRYDPSR